MMTVKYQYNLVPVSQKSAEKQNNAASILKELGIKFYDKVILAALVFAVLYPLQQIQYENNLEIESRARLAEAKTTFLYENLTQLSQSISRLTEIAQSNRNAGTDKINETRTERMTELARAMASLVSVRTLTGLKDSSSDALIKALEDYRNISKFTDAEVMQIQVAMNGNSVKFIETVIQNAEM
ncbi:hypothetical protein [Sneathiella glossodoripedis]|uniref:hypothetical protein n=1 Tax=Sneathiella glossodoripedis TaxID=418853 RepID=UPI00046FAECF|nr:hypothetical protein [Sneathiella glossodoripedis]